ncbi:MAG: carboxypeptidase regulatory-like domain-containing protein, partial [Bacteroidota bacterium]
MRPTLLTLLALCGCGLMGQVTLTGVVSTGDDEPVPYATIRVQAVGDTADLGATYTDAAGKFSLPVTTGESIRVTASFLGYETVVKEGSVTDRFTFRLEVASTTLTGVQVAARRLTTYALSGGVALDVAGNASLAGSSGLEVLELLPAVNLDGESSVSIRGNANVRLFINGRETNRSTASLRNLSAERIERVELYTSPPARFDADGSGGVINIILRKSQQAGRRLTLDGQLTDPGRVGGGFQG